MRRSAATAFTAVAAAPAFVAVGATGSTSAAKPSGVTTGDLILIAAGTSGGTVPGTPTGFTSLGSAQDGAFGDRLYLFGRIADGSEGSSFFVSSADAVVAIAYRNLSSATPRAIQTQVVTGAGTTVTYPAVSSAAGDLVVGVLFFPNTATVTTPSGHTERLDATAGSFRTFQIVDLTATGSVASVNCAVSSNPSANPRLTVRAAFPPA